MICLDDDTRSRWRARKANWDEPVSREWMLLAESFDLHLSEIWGKAKANAKGSAAVSLGNEAPRMPRPWDKVIEKEKRGGREPMNAEQRAAFLERFEAIKKAHNEQKQQEE